MSPAGAYLETPVVLGGAGEIRDQATMVEENGYTDHYSQRRQHGDHHNPYAFTNGISGGIRESMEVIGDAGDDGAVHISHRISGINFTPTLHDSLVNEIRKLRNKLDKKENEVKSLNDELGK